MQEQSFTTVAKPVHCLFRIIIYHCEIGVFLSYQTNLCRTINPLGVTSVGQPLSKSPKIVIPPWVSCPLFDFHIVKWKLALEINVPYYVQVYYTNLMHVYIFTCVPIIINRSTFCGNFFFFFVLQYSTHFFDFSRASLAPKERIMGLLKKSEWSLNHWKNALKKSVFGIRGMLQYSSSTKQKKTKCEINNVAAVSVIVIILLLYYYYYYSLVLSLSLPNILYNIKGGARVLPPRRLLYYI